MESKLLQSYRMASVCVAGVNKRILFKRVSFAARIYFKYYSSLNAVNNFFDETPLRKFLFEIPGFSQNIYKQQIRQFFHRGSLADDRARYLRSHFSLIEKLHTDDCVKKMYLGILPSLTIFHEGDWLTLEFTYQNHVEREGLLMLSLKMNGVTLYKVFFWLMIHGSQPALCIGAFQGGKNTLEPIREFTKKFWGLRPQNFMLSIIRWYAEALALPRIYTFPKEKFWNKNISHLTDLDEFWVEQGCMPVAESHFIQIPHELPRKSLEDIPTRKRSMYKKRYTFLDEAKINFINELSSLLR